MEIGKLNKIGLIVSVDGYNGGVYVHCGIVFDFLYYTR